MRTKNHGLLTRSVAALVSTTIAGTTVLQGCGGGRDEVIVDVSTDFSYERGTVTFERADGTRHVESFDAGDPAVVVPAGATRAMLDLIWRDGPIGSASIAGDLGAADALEFAIGRDAVPFAAGSFAQYVEFPRQVGEGGDIAIEVGLAPGVNPIDVTGTIGLDGALGELYPPLDLQVCGPKLCGNYHMYWSGQHAMRLTLHRGTEVAEATVPVEGTYSEETAARAALFAQVIETLPDGTFSQVPEETAFLTYAQCVVAYLVLARMNEMVLEGVAISPELAMATLAMTVVQPAALLGDTQQYVIVPWIGIVLRLLAAAAAWLRARLAWNALRAAAPGVATTVARQAFYAAALSAAVIGGQALLALYERRAAKTREHDEAIRNQATQEAIEKIKAEIAVLDSSIKVQEETNRINQQRVEEERARQAAEEAGQ